MAVTLGGNRAAASTANTAPHTAGGPQGGSAAAIPFPRASRRKTILAGQTGPTTLSTSAVNIPPVQVPAAGHLACIEMQVTIASSGNSATVALGTGFQDQPWNLINQVSVVNAAGDNIISPVDGYALYLINKYGATRGQPPFVDPRGDRFFSALTTGGGATAGSGTFRLFIPFEIDTAQAFCAVPNLAANKAYTVQILLNPLSTLYTGASGNGTSPNGTVTASITLISHYWSVPNAVNAGGVAQQQAPTGSGSVALWQIEPALVSAGDKLIQSHNVGNVIREIIMVLRDSSGFRTTTGLPTLWQIVLNNDTVEYKPDTSWQAEIGERFGYMTGTVDTAGGLDTGVRVWSQPLVTENNRPGADRSQYLITQDATLLQFRATSFGAAASTLQLYTHSIKPISAAALYEPHVR